MVLINQKVADEIGTLVARHRYAVEDAKDAVKAAESASAAKNEEIKEAAAERHKGLVEQAEKSKEAQDKSQNEWASRRKDEANEISFGEDEPEYEPETPQRPVPQAAPPPPPAPRATPRRPAFDEDDDYQNESWLR